MPSLQTARQQLLQLL